MNPRQTLIEKMRQRLAEDLATTDVELVDESGQHAGHAGVTSETLHLGVHVVSDRFEGLSAMERQRLVYGSLITWMPQPLHAVRFMATDTPDEARA